MQKGHCEMESQKIAIALLVYILPCNQFKKYA